MCVGVCGCRVCVWVMDVQMLQSVYSVYGESPLERLREGRRERPPISCVRLAAHRECVSECIATRSLSSTVTSAGCFSTNKTFLSVLLTP